MPVKEALEMANEYERRYCEDIIIKKEIPGSSPPPLGGETVKKNREKRKLEERTEGPEFEPIEMPELSAETKTQIFEHRLAQTEHNSNDYIAVGIPPLAQITRSLDSLEQQNAGGGGAWFHEYCTSGGTKEYPKIEIVSPEYVQTFLRPPNSKRERLCLPPCNPKTGEFLVCESVQMGGPILREFLLPSQQRDGSAALPQLQRSCWLCTQKTITYTFNVLKNSDKDVEYLIHEYEVPVNTTGGYKMELILPGFKKFCGVVGPVLAHNREHYVLMPGNAGWKQSEKMLFHNGATKLQ